MEVNTVMYDTIRARWLGYEVEKAGKFGFLDTSLNISIPIEYEYLEYAGGFFIAKSDGKFGTISASNEIIHDFVYDRFEKKMLEAVKIYKEGKVGILSSTGTELLPPVYDKINQVNWNNIEVSIDGKSEIINIAKLESEQAEKNSKQ